MTDKLEITQEDREADHPNDDFVQAIREAVLSIDDVSLSDAAIFAAVMAYAATAIRQPKEPSNG